MGRIGIVAGWGVLPVLAARAASRRGAGSVVCAVVPDVHPELATVAESLLPVGLGQLDAILTALHQHNADAVLFAGKVKKEMLYAGLTLDRRLQTVLAGLPELSDESIMRGIALEFERDGLHVLDQADFFRDQLASAGVISGRAPSPGELRDARYGLAQAKTVAAAGIGQTIVVRDRVVVAVEAVEGTDATIRRGGELARGGAIVIKVAKPSQDTRFDVPTVGVETIRAMRESNCSCLAIEAGSTFILEREELVRAADAGGVAIVALEAAATTVAATAAAQDQSK